MHSSGRGGGEKEGRWRTGRDMGFVSILRRQCMGASDGGVRGAMGMGWGMKRDDFHDIDIAIHVRGAVLLLRFKLSQKISRRLEWN
jgi:hypothetical protein